MPSARARTLRAIAANVQTWRTRRALTQAQLAELAELDVRFLQRVEQGRINFGVVALIELAEALSVTPAALLRPAELAQAKRGRPRAAKQGLAKPRAYPPGKEPNVLAVAEPAVKRRSKRR
jgi:transcriptional regulator with XRE-family HTH domain